jgi:hypothetical protein
MPDFGNSSITAYSGAIGVGSTLQSSGRGLVTVGFLLFTIDQECLANTDEECLVPLAVKCSLWPAILTLGASVDMGQLQQDVLSSQPLKHYQDTTEIPWMQIPKRILRNGSWKPCSSTKTSTGDNTMQVYGSNNKVWRLSLND